MNINKNVPIPAHCLLSFQRQRLAVQLLRQELSARGVQIPWMVPINPDNASQVRTHSCTDLVQFMNPPGRSTNSNDPRTKVIGEIEIDGFGDPTPSQATFYIDDVMQFILPTSKTIYREAMQGGDAPKSLNTTIADFSELEEEALDSVAVRIVTRRDESLQRRHGHGHAENLAGGKVKRRTYGK